MHTLNISRTSHLYGLFHTEIVTFASPFIYTVSQTKTRNTTHVDIIVTYWSIFRIFSPLD